MKLYCGVFDEDHFTFKIYGSEIKEETDEYIKLNESFPPITRLIDYIDKVKIDFHKCIPIDNQENGFFYISKSFNRVEDMLHSYRQSEISKLKERLNQFESHLITIVNE